MVSAKGRIFYIIDEAPVASAAFEPEWRLVEGKAFIETWRPEEHWRVWREKAPLKHLVANDAGTGRLLWKKDDADTKEIMPTAMAVSDRRVFIQNEKAIVALDAGTGKEIWRSDRPINLHSPGSSSPTLVAAGGVVICADREVRKIERKQDEQDDRSVDWYVYPHTDHSRKGETIAYDAATGKRLWNVDSVENFKAPADIFVLNDTAYVRCYTPGLGVGIDLRTGKVKKPLKKKSPIRDPGSHWRCYRNKATEKYLILCQRWSEFYDLETRVQTSVNFVRGSCQYGQMPCNGLLYAPHDSCACSIESKLNSIKALAPVANPTEDIPGAMRLEKGPAFGKTRNPKRRLADLPTRRSSRRCYGNDGWHRSGANVGNQARRPRYRAGRRRWDARSRHS